MFLICSWCIQWCNKGVVFMFVGNMCLELLMKVFMFSLFVQVCRVLVLKLCNQLVILFVCLLQWFMKFLKFLLWVRLRLFLLVSRNLWFIEFMVLYRLMVMLVLCSCLVVIRLVGLLLIMVVCGVLELVMVCMVVCLRLGGMLLWCCVYCVDVFCVVFFLIM